MATVRTFSSTMGNRALGKLTIVHNGQSDEFDPADGNSTVTITGTVFFATYGTTTFDQVKTARSNGCHIIARREVRGGDLYGMLKQASSSEFYFNYVDDSGNNAGWKLDNKDIWSTD